MRTARAKGLRRRTALIKHALRTALIPAATIFVYSFALIFVGATFTEKIFGWHGMGELLVTSIQGNDTNAVAAVTLFVAVLVLLASFLQDFVVALLDPRVRVAEHDLSHRIPAPDPATRPRARSTPARRSTRPRSPVARPARAPAVRAGRSAACSGSSLVVLLILMAFVGPHLRRSGSTHDHRLRDFLTATEQAATGSAPTRSATTCSPPTMRGMQKSL